jgi:hypothetical protein
MMMRRGLTGTVGRQAQRKLLGTAVTKTAKSASKSTKKGLKFKKGRVAKKPKVAKTSVKKKQAQLAIKGPNRKAIAGPKLSKSYPVGFYYYSKHILSGILLIIFLIVASRHSISLHS